MKKILQFIIFISLSSIGIAQNCLPNGIIFNSQEDLDVFLTNYPNCTQIEGDVFVEGFQSNITDLSGLINITSIGGDLYISNTDQLTSLTGLENLESVQGYLKIGDNDGSQMGNYNLNSLEALSSLNFVGEDFEISHSPFLSSLLGLENLSYIGGGLSINNNNTLIDLTSLAGITSLSKHLAIYDNFYLENLNGLDNIASIGTGLHIRSNANLNTLIHLLTLSSVGGDLYIYFNGSLESLDGLNHLATVGGQITISINNILSNIEGLSNIDAETINGLTITNNSMLLDCAVKSICDYLSSTGSVVDINNNSTGCDNQQQVEDACETIWVADNIKVSDIKLYYSSNEKTISILNSKIPNQIKIYNIAGQELINKKEFTNVIDVSSFKKGIYIIEIQIDNQYFRNKITI